MESISAVFGAVFELFKLEFSIMGVTFSLWQVIIWTTVAGIILGFVRRLFYE